ncbi:MAG: hypothetical protein ACRDZ4_15360 [Egibacteraceae bacterium]
MVSLVTAAVALASALLSVVLSSRAAKATARFQHELELRRRRASKEELVQELMARYREPLVRAAFDLQSRIFNIVRQGFLVKYCADGTEGEREYAVRNTVFVLAEYLGWVEILRREVQFLDLGDVERNRRLVEWLEAVSDILSTDRRITDPGFRLFRGQQRALGELMIEPIEWTRAGAKDEPARGRCMGYAAFVAKLETEPSFARWFDKLEADVERLAADPASAGERLIPLQQALIDLIDFLDDPPARFPVAQRTKLPG